MQTTCNPQENYENTKKRIGYLPRKETTLEVYARLGFRSGLEIHQQLKTEKKLFCRCPAGLYQKKDEYDGELIRHMRPTLSELGEYDGTALMEFKTRKNIIYRIKNETACTYDIDDTPPFPLNREALDIAMEVALLLKCSIVGEFHITRKQYLDGSIPTGFQRTGILGIEGEIPLSQKMVRIIQLSIEEEACREVSDIGHVRIYTTDRLGMPLIETVTYPDMQTPDEVAETAHHLRFLTRSTGKVRTGIGAAREDVNVSIAGGTRVEIKGVAHIRWIPELTHNEAFRQKALLEIKRTLHDRIPDPEAWEATNQKIDPDFFHHSPFLFQQIGSQDYRIVAVNLPQFRGLLSFFTQPGKVFADELSDRLKVIACIDKPNMTHSESLDSLINPKDLTALQRQLGSNPDDAQVILWGPEEDMATALETVEERCRLAFQGVPNETRKSFENGTTIFERVLPGPDRMYPDTDSAPIPITETLIEKARQNLPLDTATRIEQLKTWGIPADTYPYILKRNLFPLIARIVSDYDLPPRFVGTLIGHDLKSIEGTSSSETPFEPQRLLDLLAFVRQKNLEKTILKAMLPVVHRFPDIDFETALGKIGYKPQTKKEIVSRIPALRKKFRKIKKSKTLETESLWLMGQLRPLALGNLPLDELRKTVDGGPK